MTAPKTLVSWGYSGKVESPYGTINANGVGDGILLKEIPVIDWPKWINMGDRGVTPAGGVRQNAQNSGRWGSFKLVAEGIGSAAGQAYAAGVKPQLDTLILASGWGGTGSFTAGQENWLYNPVAQPTALTSITSEAVVGGTMYRLFGAYGDIASIEGAGPEIPKWNIDLNGAADLEVDAAIPAFTSYPNMAQVPVKADSITLKIGLFTAAVVKSFKFTQGRNIKTPRVNMAGGFTQGMSGFTPGERAPTIEVVIERVALATVTPWNTATTLNPMKLAEDAVPVLFQLSVGALQYRRWHIFSGNALTTGAPNPSAQCILKDVKPTKEGPTATWTLTLEFFPSTYGASDDVSILFN